MDDTVATTESEASPQVPVDRLVRAFLKMRTAKEKLVKEHEEEVAKLEEGLKTIKLALLGYCKDNNIDSAKIAGVGMFYRGVKKRYWTNDWEAMGRFVLEHEVPELFEKRLHQGNMESFLEQHPELLPPGLNVDSEFTITVRRA
jgi:hypothetical protein